jgi:glycosyltransferase involved in cell wall biosynthesis
MRRALGLPPQAPVILTVARFAPQKGHQVLLEAIPTVLAHQPAAQFLWVGDGPLLPALRARAKSLGVGNHLHFLGRRDDVPELLGAADLFVLPSRFEGLPLAVLEAMAAGLPVVGTQVCGTQEAVADGRTGQLVPPDDPPALANAITALLSQPALAARFGAAGQQRFARLFGAGRMAQETADLYGELLRRPRLVEPSANDSVPTALAVGKPLLGSTA